MYWTVMYFQTIFWRGQFIPVEIKSTNESNFMPIFREQASISYYEHTKSISIRTYVRKVVQRTAIHKICNEQIERF